MRLVINGEAKEFAGISTLDSLVEQLGLQSDRLAIELNRDIVPRSNWGQTALQEGDQLEIVHFVGGGAV
jgi:thiamine biosynthesis protein ThiS